MVGWLVGWTVGWLVGWLVGWMVGYRVWFEEIGLAFECRKTTSCALMLRVHDTTDIHRVPSSCSDKHLLSSLIFFLACKQATRQPGNQTSKTLLLTIFPDDGHDDGDDDGSFVLRFWLMKVSCAVDTKNNSIHTGGVSTTTQTRFDGATVNAALRCIDWAFKIGQLID